MGARLSSPEVGRLRPPSLAGSAAAEGAPCGQRSRQAASPSGRRSPSRAPAGPALPPRTTSSNRFALPLSSTVNRRSSWVRARIRNVVILFITANSQLVLLIRGTMSRFSPQRTAQPRRLASEVFQSPVYCIRLYLYISIWCRFCFSNSFIVALHIGFWHPYRNIFALVDELGISPFTGWNKAAYYSPEGLTVISLLHFLLLTRSLNYRNRL